MAAAADLTGTTYTKSTLVTCDAAVAYRCRAVNLPKNARRVRICFRGGPGTMTQGRTGDYTDGTTDLTGYDYYAAESTFEIAAPESGTIFLGHSALSGVCVVTPVFDDAIGYML